MRYHSKATAEEIKAQHMWCIGKDFISQENGLPKKLTLIAVNPAGFEVNVNGEVEQGYLCVFWFESSPAINATLFMRLNNLPLVDGTFPAIVEA